MEQDLTEFARRHIASTAPIDLDDAASRTAWCAELGITEARLVEVVASVGKMPAAVRYYLGSTGGPVKELTVDEKAERASRPSSRGPRLFGE